MAKSRPKLEVKKVLLAKGEYLAMGVAGAFLAVLLVWGAYRWSDAKDPKKISDDLALKSRNVHNRIGATDLSDEEKKVLDQPDWLRKPYKFPTVPVGEFALTGPAFDPTANPDTLRENPAVLKIEKYQVDLVRSAMPAFDVYTDPKGVTWVGMVGAKQVTGQDKQALEKLRKTVKERLGATRPAPRPAVPPPPVAGGEDAGGRGGVNPYGGPGGAFDVSAQRVEKAIEYVRLADFDKAAGANKVPAATVVPLRMVVLHAEVPYRRQVEEIKRALRLKDLAEAQRWGPLYDGYEVQRRVTRVVPGKKDPEVVLDWSKKGESNYDFEAVYGDLIHRRKLGDEFDDPYLSYFLRYDMALALPLPQLIKELGVKYPEIRLEAINAAVKKLEESTKTPPTQSDVLKRLSERPPRDALYKIESGAQTGGAYLGGEGLGVQSFNFDPTRPPGPGAPMPGAAPAPPGPGAPPRNPPVKPGDESNLQAAPPVEVIENLLLRFVDVDVRPGYTYEYRVRLRMTNPNVGLKKGVKANHADVKELFSPWTQIAGSVTVPPESFVFAADRAGYVKRVEEEYANYRKDPKERELRNRLLPRDNQAVVEMLAWMEQVKTDAGGKREPVGAWVVADVPVGRGEYVGRRQYVKLPLWSGETNQYVLREAADKVVTTTGKDVPQPKGWLVDFSTRAVLVDFEGGRVASGKPGSSPVVEDVAAELLIVRPDGKLVVRRSAEDERNEDRQKVVGDWEKWVKEVEKRKAGEAAGGGEFSRPGERPPGEKN